MPIRRHPVAAGATAAKFRDLPIDAELIGRLKTVFDQLRAHDLRLAEIFYAKLFNAAPHLMVLFHRAPAEQAEKLIISLESVVRNFENPETNATLLAGLGKRHASYGVKAEHYDLVIDLMIESMQQLLGPQADRRHLDEWRTALRPISDQMIAAAADESISSNIS